MKNRRTILWLLIGIVLLAFVHVVLRSYDEGHRQERRRTLFESRDDVLCLKIERRGSAVLVIRKDEGGNWHITEPFSGPADKQTVYRILDILSQTPIGDVVSDNELLRLGRTRADFSLEHPLVKVSLETAKATERISFGVLTPSSDGVYAALDGVGAVFVVPIDLLSAVDQPTERLRRRTLFSAAVESISTFTLRQGKGVSLSFARDGDGWKVDGELASQTRVEGFLAELLSAEALDFIWPLGVSNETQRASASLLASYGLELENAVTVTLKGLDEKDVQLSLGRAASPGRVYASIQNGNAVITVKESLKAAALQKKTAFADFRLFPVSESSVSRFRLVDGETSYVLAKSSDGIWQMEAPVAAPAEQAVVRRLLARILVLPTSAVQQETKGFSVSLSADVEPICVPRDLVLEKDRLDDLRSLEMIRINPKVVKRLVQTTGEKTRHAISVVRGREDGTWTLESANDRLAVDPKKVAEILKTLDPLVAMRIEKLKVLAADLDRYGLGVPFLTVAVDLDREDAIRRNILIGAKTKGGRFATVGSTDAVFVLSNEIIDRLSQKPVGDKNGI